MRICRKALNVTAEKNYYCIRTNCIEIRLYFLTDTILRIRAGFDGSFSEASYTLQLTAWEDELDPFMKETRVRKEAAESSIFSDDCECTVINGKELRVVIEKNPFVIKVYDYDGNLLHSDIPDLAYVEDTNLRRSHTSLINRNDCFFGFGEKTGPLNKSQKYLSMSPKDSLGYNPAETDSLYKHIPFYIRLNEENGIATGYFYHNTYECDFDMGREHSNYWKPHSRYRTDGGDIDLFFIAGPDVRKVVQGYTLLTGKSAMLPKYALGYLGSSMYYAELPENCDSAIEEFIVQAEEEKIPVDGFQLSSGYTTAVTSEGEKRCVFTWNKKRFPDPSEFFAVMKKHGITVSPNVKPGILLSHPDYEKFAERKMLVLDSENTSLPATGTWWGGKGVFVDFTNPAARKEWEKLLTENILDYGTASVWNDNCEYDSLVDKDSLCSYENKGGTIGQLKSVMANLMCRVTLDAVQKKFPDERPFVVCRSGHSGIQMLAQSWAGDNRTGWDTLRYNVATILGMSLSGVSNYGADIGGFYGDAPEPELFVRWVQNGIFQQRFSIHSVNADNTVTEPWMYPEYTGLVREAVKLRYSLFPYYYSLMFRSNQTGIPVLEPMCSAFQSDRKLWEEDENFMVGDSLLAASVLEKNASVKKVTFPSGIDFYDFYTYRKYSGGSTYEIPVTIKDVPLFIKCGGIVPVAMNEIYNLTKQTVTELKLICAAEGSGKFVLYEDDGLTNEWKKGNYLTTEITMEGGAHTIINFERKGNYASTIRKILLSVIYRKSCPYNVKVCGNELKKYLNQKQFDSAETGWYYDLSRRCVLVKYGAPQKDYSVEINFEPFDMLGM